MPKTYRTLIECLFMFLIVFGLWQIWYIFSSAYSLPEGIRDLMNAVVQIAIVAIFTLAIILNGSNFGEYGFKWFEDSRKQIAISVCLAGVYILITLYFQGLIVGFSPLPPIPLPQVFIEFTKALIASFATELVFRGYMQGKLTKAYGFLPALYISSFLFSLHALSILTTSALTDIVVEIMRVFVLGIFLGLFFQRTKSLVGPLSFQTTKELAYCIIPTATIPLTYIRLIFEVIAIICVILLMNVSVPKQNKSKFWFLT